MLLGTSHQSRLPQTDDAVGNVFGSREGEKEAPSQTDDSCRSTSIASLSCHTDDATSNTCATLDLTEAARIQTKAGVTIITQICDIVGMTIDEVVFVWSSPPCESYTWLGYTNESRGNHFRNHQTEEKEPRSVESCKTENDLQKRITAQNHDLLTEGITQSMLLDNRMTRMYHHAMENPRGMLQQRPFMLTREWLRDLDCQTVTALV